MVGISGAFACIGGNVVHLVPLYLGLAVAGTFDPRYIGNHLRSEVIRLAPQQIFDPRYPKNCPVSEVKAIRGREG